MTGFGRSSGALAGVQWTWEIRSVNGRGLELRLKLAPGHELLEPQVRDLAQKRLVRGNVNITLAVRRDASPGTLRLNEPLLKQAIAAVERAEEFYKGPAVPISAILAIRGVLDVAETDEDDVGAAARNAAIMIDAGIAIDALNVARADEGRRLGVILFDNIEKITAIVDALDKLPQRKPEAIRSRLDEQIARLFQSTSRFDETRLHQEAMLLATKFDIEEELGRLRSHTTAASALLKEGQAVGRKYDFLSQEFNREANTICSKSNDVEITRLGLELKALIDQMREQVQNIE